MSTLQKNLAAGVLALAVAPAAFAGSITLDATDVGLYNQNGSHSSLLTTGWDADPFNPANSVEFRHYTVFDLSGVTDTIIDAKLKFTEPPGGYGSPDGSEVLGIFDVSNAISTLTGGTGGTTVFNDLGGGTSYGSVDVLSTDTAISIALNASAVTALNAATGKFAFGGAVTSLAKGSKDELVLYTTITSNVAPQLVLTTAPAGGGGGGGSIPEPPVVLLMLAGLLGWSTVVRARIS